MFVLPLKNSLEMETFTFKRMKRLAQHQEHPQFVTRVLLGDVKHTSMSVGVALVKNNFSGYFVYA